MRSIAILAAGLVLPAAALAQTPSQQLEAQQRALQAQQRMLEQQQQQQLYIQGQRLDQIQQQQNNLELRLNGEQNLRDVQAQRALTPPPFNGPLVSPAPPATPRDLSEAEQRRQASIAASEARLRALAEQINR